MTVSCDTSRALSQDEIEERSEAEIKLTTLSVYQALLLFQVEKLTNTPGVMEAVTTAHGLKISTGHFMQETMCSEADWLQRAQARALERLDLVRPNEDNTRWALTAKGRSIIRWLRGEIIGQLPKRESSPT